jgi:predicted PurR-regulated permease PerM
VPVINTDFKLASNTSQRVIAIGVILAVCYLAQAVVVTVLCSLLVACMMEPVVGALMRFRLPRGVAALLVCLLALAVLYLLAGLFYARGVAFMEQLPVYETTIREAVEKISQHVQNLEARITRFVPQERQQKIVQAIETRRPRTRAKQEPPPAPQPEQVPEVRVKEERGFITRYIVPKLGFFYEFLLFASFIPFLVYFMLSWKDHMRHGFVNLFALENRQVAHKTLNAIGEMVRGFLVGNLLIGILLATVSSLLFWFLRIPFPFMMGSMSGLLSVIPYVGLPLAIIPPLFAALGSYNSLSSYLVVVAFVSGLHLLALNVLYPKLVGSRVHLNPLAVTVAILTWGWMWGGIGLILAIPVTGSLKAVFDNVPGWRSYGDMLGD